MRPIRRLPAQHHLYVPAQPNTPAALATTARESAVVETFEYPFELLAYADGTPCPIYANPVPVTQRKTRHIGVPATA